MEELENEKTTLADRKSPPSGANATTGSGSGDPSSKLDPKRSPKASCPERHTDDSIFELGEAAQLLENLDDVLTGFGADLQTALQQQQQVTDFNNSSFEPNFYKPQRRPSLLTDKIRFFFPRRKGDEEAAGNLETGGSEGGVQVSTLQKQNTADGKIILLRIVQGPIRGSRRMVRVTKETVAGQEFVTEFEAEADCDVREAIDKTPFSVLQSMRSGLLQRRDSAEYYDNLKPTFCDKETAFFEKEERERLLGKINCEERGDDDDGDEDEAGGKRRGSGVPLLSNGGINAAAITMENLRQQSSTESDDIPTQLPLPSQPKLRLNKRVSFSRIAPPSCKDEESPKVYDQEGKVASKSLIPLRKRFESVTEDDIRPYLLYSEPEQESDDEDEAHRHRRHHSLCWACAKLIKIKSKAMPTKLIHLSKAKSCLTSSEISEDDDGLPAPQAVLANYARMLVENRPQFVETMFRAVKLNNVGVTRILCKIIQKCGLKLGQRDFRETESSANILHVALLYNHVDIVSFLLETGDRDLIIAKYETNEYRNQTGLHVAVANGNVELVERLILALEPEDRVSLVNTLADGHYFKTQHPHGQMCLTAAAWAGHGEVIKTLVKYGGNLAMKNLFGNTLLHSIILQTAQSTSRNDYKTLFNVVWEAAEIWAEQMNYDTKFAQQREFEKSQMQVNFFKELLGIRNNDGYTPLALATTKNPKLFLHLINLEKIYKIPQNRLGSIAWVTYDVTDITSFARNTYNKFSVLHILAHNSQHLSRHANLDDMDEDYMEMEPVRTMLTRKWDVYRWIYILWFVTHLIYMILFTAVTVQENTSPFNPDPVASAVYKISQFTLLLDLRNYTRPLHQQSMSTTPQRPRLGLVIFTILPMIYLVMELLDLFGSTPYRIQFMTGQNYATRILKSIRSEWTITGNGPYRMVAVGFSIFTVYWFLLYTHRHEYQDMGLAMALLLGWIFVLFFARACRVTCRFSIMIQKMFFRDLIYFLTVYAIVLVGFSFAMNAMFGESAIGRVFYDMMSVVTDLDQKQNAIGARHPMFAKLLLIFYAIIAVILLMNMLIAMMNTSYETIRVTRCNLWRQQQLSILLMMERRFFWFKWLCSKSERDVWKKVDARSNDGEERCFVDVTMLHRPGYTRV